MIVLALDTTLASCSAALWDGRAERILAAECAAMDKGHAEAIAPMVQRCLAAASQPASTIARIAVTTGPGTFTGLRIGLSLAHGMGVALGCEIVGLDTLTATAAPLLETTPALLVAHQAGATGKFYAARFENGTLADPLLFDGLEAVTALLGQDQVAVIGTGADAVRAAAQGKVTRLSGHDLPVASDFVRLAAGLPAATGLPQPVYLREPDARPQAPFTPETIRLAGEADIAGLSRLHRMCFSEGWSEDSLRSTLSMPGVLALLAERDGSTRALLVLRSVAGEAEVLTLCTAPHWRRRALGGKLLAAGRELLRAQSVTVLHLEVAADNSAARALYLAQGFAETGRRKGYYARHDAPACDAILMAVSP
jgi:tRNA threonylcarbamoyladenosine biosynthesis protein TsaB